MGGLVSGIAAYFVAANWGTIAATVTGAFTAIKTGILAHSPEYPFRLLAWLRLSL